MRGFQNQLLYLPLALLAFALIGIFFVYQAGHLQDEQQVALRSESAINELVQELDKKVLAWHESSEQSLPVLNDIPVDFFIVANQEIREWTGNHFLPPARLASDAFEIKHIRTGAGDFLIRKWPTKREEELVAVVPLYIHYKIQNQYLEPSWNEVIFSDFQVSIGDANSLQGTAVTYNGNILFKIQLLHYSTISTADVIATACFLISLLLVFFWLFQLEQHVFLKKPALMFLVYAATVVGIRYMMVTFSFPSRFLAADVFDPKYFASSDLNPSIGDLLINSMSVTFLCWIVFRNFLRIQSIQHALKHRSWRMTLKVFSSLAVLFGMLFPYVVIQTIYNNSVITLSITESLQFDWLRLLALFSLIFAWLSSFLWMHVFIRVLLIGDTVSELVIALLTGALVFAGINEWSNQVYLPSLIIGLLYALVILWTRLYATLRQFRYITFAYFFTAVVALSLNSLEAVTYFSGQRSARDQSRFAASFLIDRDDFGEFLLSEISQKISNDLFIQTRISGLFVNKEAVKQKIRQVFLPGYFNKYRIDIHLFTASGDPLDELDPPMQTWRAMMSEQAADTGYGNIFFLSRPDTESARKYLIYTPVKRSDLVVGYILLELSLKRVIPENVYPELLVDSRFQQTFRSQDFSYAVFNQGIILFQSGNFNYTVLRGALVDDPRLYREGLRQFDYRHVAQRDTSGRMVVVSAPLPSFTYRLADFSFLVILGFAVVIAYLFMLGTMEFIRHERLLMSTRIQIILNLSFLIPLIAVSVITLGLTAQSNLEQLHNEYLTKARNFTNEMAGQLTEAGNDGVSFEQNFTQLGKLANLDANLFTQAGRLQYTTQPGIFENQLLSPFINPVALDRIRQGDRAFIMDERVGGLNYFVAYSGMHSPSDGSLLAIAAIPFFQSAYLLEKMQITVLANILSIFTGIFIVLVIVSFWVSRWLTFPLRMITQKLGRVSLMQSNQPLEWPSDDEIGLLVREYNQMLISLSDSKRELEQTQRERAWREIAQQVAHEIKNPLTPMKLTLQKLERMAENDPQKMEKLQKAVASILSQVDTLDGVASSFSTFAKMPEPVMTEVEVIGLIKKSVHLHSQEAEIAFQSEYDTIYVLADEQLLSRIFSNILLNAIQAARPSSGITIKISVQRSDNRISIAISDNGTGIPANLRDKIFLPHFSTKKSGSGLGLAIARQGLEQMGGVISFESRTGKGTTFRIELPVIERET